MAFEINHLPGSRNIEITSEKGGYFYVEVLPDNRLGFSVADDEVGEDRDGYARRDQGDTLISVENAPAAIMALTEFLESL